ncbi:MAG: acyl-CoA dehydrogenase family protein [Candidatus Obscuribacter sp.]|nr:acyl-CoA dehydrogenase family protein [Candidatus Obscuribacter sp.]MBL0185225.1 acyl-CoA dehydrogenase family protein [Candidatus Obscuribacter sp.]MBP6350744.1 acyl-CoA dehydrogenase family protein [Candidatus Obscuribacter sp.]MBP6592733.1 acyl-CoA dehydrogenase family protein [Candidatus Obscuribacter sp.]MBP7575665.1 acyl-CoA dehydrogenase family protein [Candidatus Obscuribacter sp.]
MNTFLSTSQKALQEQYIKFVEGVITPQAQDLDNGKACLKEVMSKFAQAGYLGITIPKEFGGQGGTLLDLVLLSEAVAEQAAGLSVALASHYSVVATLLKAGSDSQKSRYLPLLARGEMFGAQAFSEENAGSDLNAVETTFTADGSAFKLSGVKTWVVNAGLPALFAVLGHDKDNKLVCFIVDNSEASAIHVSERKAIMGFHSASIADVTFKDFAVPADNQLVCDCALDLVNSALDVSKTVVAGAAIGLAQKALLLSADRANGRVQFGAPIAKNQGVQWKLADLSTESSAARLLTYRAAWAQTAEADKFAQFAAMAKLFASRVARFHSGEAVQIFGMLGASSESPIERIYRDAKLTELFEGTSDLQKVIIKEKLGV